jgi:hypothetical protein
MQRVQHSIESLNQAIRDLRGYILDLRPVRWAAKDYERLESPGYEFRANTLAKYS